MLLEPGTPLLVESPTYSGALAGLRPLAADLLPVTLDSQGVQPAAFEQAILLQQAKVSLPLSIGFLSDYPFVGQARSSLLHHPDRTESLWRHHEPGTARSDLCPL